MLSIGNGIFKKIQGPDPDPDHDQNRISSSSSRYLPIKNNLKIIASKLWPVSNWYTNKQTDKQTNKTS